MISLSAIPLYLSLIFTLSINNPAASQEKETAFSDKMTSKRRTLKKVEVKEEKQADTLENASAPSTPTLDNFSPALEKIVSPLLKRSHLREKSENEQEANFNKTPPNSPLHSSQLTSRVQKFQSVSLLASVDFKGFSKLKREYEPPFSFSISSSSCPPILYTYEFQDIDLEPNKLITLAENFPINWEKLPLYFTFTFMGYSKTKNRDTIFELEMEGTTDFKPQVIDRGEIGRGITKRALLKYFSPEEKTNSLPISVLLNISLFNKEQTNVLFTMGQKVK